MRYKASLVRKVTLVNQYLRVFSGTGTRFRSREQLIPVPVPVPGLPVAALVYDDFAQEISASQV